MATCNLNEIVVQGPIPAICNTFLLKIPKFNFLPIRGRNQALNPLGLYLTILESSQTSFCNIQNYF